MKVAFVFIHVLKKQYYSADWLYTSTDVVHKTILGNWTQQTNFPLCAESATTQTKDQEPVAHAL